MSYADHFSQRGQREQKDVVSSRGLRYTVNKLLTSLQTCITTANMHANELKRLCRIKASARQIEAEKKKILQEEEDMQMHIKSLKNIKASMSDRDQITLENDLKPIFEEYNRTLENLEDTFKFMQKSSEAMVSQQMSAAVHHSDAPEVIDLGEDGELIRLDSEYDEALELELQAKAERDAMMELNKNAAELSEMFRTIMSNVKEQGENLDSIEEHITETSKQVHEGTLALIKTAKMRSQMYPIAGAVIGGAVLGPLGLLAGMKGAGVVTAVAGLGVGGFLGNIWKKTNVKEADKLENDLRDNSDAALMPPENKKLK